MTNEERNEIVKDIVKFCDETDCDTCPIKKRKLCYYGNWYDIDDATLATAMAVIAFPNSDIFVNGKEVKEEHNNPISPDHYKNRNMECIDEMVAVFGAKATITFCGMNAWKYRYRADYKGQKEEDLNKSDWYVQKANDLRQEWGIE